MPGNIGWQGILIILVVLLLIFGPKRLPEMGRSLGRGIREFKDSITGSDKDEELDKIEIAPPAADTTKTDTAAQPQSERVSS
ncbi:MAG: Sec-independent protein translocase subunit TatA/TatB [Gaiellaceae bacterium]